MKHQNEKKISYIEKTGSAAKIGQKISALEKSNAVKKEIVVPADDRYIAKKIINNRKLSDSIVVKTV